MTVALRALAVARLYERFGLVAANSALAHVELAATVLAHLTPLTAAAPNLNIIGT